MNALSIRYSFFEGGANFAWRVFFNQENQYVSIDVISGLSVLTSSSVLFLTGSSWCWYQFLKQLAVARWSFLYGVYFILVLVGVGYRCVVIVEDEVNPLVGYKCFLLLSLGYSHNILFEIPRGVTVTCSNRQRYIYIYGFDSNVVCQFIREVRSFRRPDPYKGNGIQFLDENISLRSSNV